MMGFNVKQKEKLKETKANLETNHHRTKYRLSLGSRSPRNTEKKLLKLSRNSSIRKTFEPPTAIAKQAGIDTEHVSVWFGARTASRLKTRKELAVLAHVTRFRKPIENNSLLLDDNNNNNVENNNNNNNSANKSPAVLHHPDGTPVYHQRKRLMKKSFLSHTVNNEDNNNKLALEHKNILVTGKLKNGAESIAEDCLAMLDEMLCSVNAKQNEVMNTTNTTATMIDMNRAQSTTVSDTEQQAAEEANDSMHDDQSSVISTLLGHLEKALLHVKTISNATSTEIEHTRHLQTELYNAVNCIQKRALFSKNLNKKCHKIEADSYIIQA